MTKILKVVFDIFVYYYKLKYGNAKNSDFISMHVYIFLINKLVSF